ncbi:hypothetical protein DL768_000314 [Monosporascus sp. mg162]|nr:hypothetical protein DL768_000314 [Monosporascus sp. mg162]
MESLPIELLRLIYAYCDPPSVRNLREANRTLADVGYDYLLPPNLSVVTWRQDVDRLLSIAQHERLRGSVTSICIYLGELSYQDAMKNSWFQHFVLPPEERSEILASAWDSYHQLETRRKTVSPLHSRADDLREACSSLPNLTSVEVCFNRYPSENKVLREVFQEVACRKVDRAQTYGNLDAIITAIDRLRLSSFQIDRLPLELFRLPDHRKHWFAHTHSFANLSTLHLTLDPSGLKGQGSAIRAVNALGGLLLLAKNLRHLKLAFHPYSRGNSKFVITFRELLNGFTYTQLTDLILEGLSCEEHDLTQFLARHGGTLTRLRLGGRGLAKSHEVSLGGIHLYSGTFKSLFKGLRTKLPRLERLHLEGIFECQHHELASHEAYNFYPLTDENWQPVPCPRWVRSSRNTINCLPFEQYVLHGGPYPGASFAQQHFGG